MIMSEKNVFEVAVSEKFRFPFKGFISVEDLFDLNVKDLDSVFKSLNSQLKQAQEESLLDVKSKQDQELDMKIEIVKYIVKMKLEQQELRNQVKEKKEQKQKILEILAEKQNDSLKNKTPEELQAMLAEL
jgi:hypothetical protein